MSILQGNKFRIMYITNCIDTPLLKTHYPTGDENPLPPPYNKR